MTAVEHGQETGAVGCDAAGRLTARNAAASNMCNACSHLVDAQQRGETKERLRPGARRLCRQPFTMNASCCCACAPRCASPDRARASALEGPEWRCKTVSHQLMSKRVAMRTLRRRCAGVNHHCAQPVWRRSAAFLEMELALRSGTGREEAAAARWQRAVRWLAAIVHDVLAYPGPIKLAPFPQCCRAFGARSNSRSI